MRGSREPDLRRMLGRGELPRLVYQLGHVGHVGHVGHLGHAGHLGGGYGASGVLTLTARGARPEVFVLRRGGAIYPGGEPTRRALITRLERWAREPSIAMTFDGGVTAYPPGALHQVSMAGWARSHLEAQLDAALAEALARDLAGSRLTLRTELAPEPLDDADRRMLAALAQPRSLEEIWPLARTPRFRLLAFLHFLRAVGALALAQDGAGAVAQSSAGRSAPDPRRIAAMLLLGVDGTADLDTVKRAYRRLARALHPDLQPDADDQRRRILERRFAEVTAAYEALQ